MEHDERPAVSPWTIAKGVLLATMVVWMIWVCVTLLTVAAR